MSEKKKKISKQERRNRDKAFLRTVLFGVLAITIALLVTTPVIIFSAILFPILVFIFLALLFYTIMEAAYEGRKRGKKEKNVRKRK